MKKEIKSNGKGEGRKNVKQERKETKNEKKLKAKEKKHYVK